MFTLAHVNARPDTADAVRGVFEVLALPPREKPSCLDLQVYDHAERPGRFVTVEFWHDQAAFDKHMASPHGAASLAEPLAIQPYPRLP